MLAAHRRDFFNACTEVTAVLLENVSSGMSQCVNGKLLTHWFNVTSQKTVISSNITVQTSNKSCNAIPVVNLIFCLQKMLPLQITFIKMALQSRKQMIHIQHWYKNKNKKKTNDWKWIHSELVATLLICTDLRWHSHHWWHSDQFCSNLYD